MTKSKQDDIHPFSATNSKTTKAVILPWLTVKVLNISSENWTSHTQSFEMHFSTTPHYTVSLRLSIYNVRSSGYSQCLERTESLSFPMQALKNLFESVYVCVMFS